MMSSHRIILAAAALAMLRFAGYMARMAEQDKFRAGVRLSMPPRR